MERLTEEEVQELISRWNRGDREAENRLADRFTPLVKAVAGRYYSAFYDDDDLEQVGYMGLFKAVERFDASRGVKFTTFAVSWIKGEILAQLRKNKEFRGKDISPAEKREGIKGEKEEGTTKDFRQKDIWSTEERAAAREFPLVVSPAGDMKDSSSTEEVDEQVVQRLWLKQALQGLNGEERKVIVMRFFKEKTQAEVGEAMGVSQRKVSRMEKKILEKMKETMR